MSTQRNTQLHFVVSSDEERLIRERMDQAGIQNLSAYLRKMAIDGYIIQLDLSDISELLRLLRHCSNNINQLVKAVHTGKNIYQEDIAEMQEQYQQLWTMANGILTSLANIPV